VRNGADRIGAERIGAERSGAERNGAERSGAERSGADRIGADRIGADFFGATLCGAAFNAAALNTGVAAASRAITAFLATVRLLIRDFFSIDMVSSPSFWISEAYRNIPRCTPTLHGACQTKESA
jgi:hypothetical protein